MFVLGVASPLTFGTQNENFHLWDIDLKVAFCASSFRVGVVWFLFLLLFPRLRSSVLRTVPGT